MDASDKEIALIAVSELMHMKNEDIKLCFSKEAALKICAKDFKKDRVEAAEIMNFCINKIFEVYDDAICDTTFHFECIELFKEITEQVLNAENVVDATNQEQLIKILDYVIKYLDCLKLLMDQKQLECSFQILEFVLIFAKKTIKFFTKYRVAVHKNTINLIKLIVKLLDANIEKWQFTTQNQYEFFKKFHVALNSLCEIKLPTSEFLRITFIHGKFLQICKDSTLNLAVINYIQIAATNNLKYLFKNVKGLVSSIKKDNKCILQPKTISVINLIARFLSSIEYIVELCAHQQCAAAAEFIDLYTVVKCKDPAQNSLADQTNKELQAIADSLLCILKLIYKNTDIFKLLHTALNEKPYDCMGFINDYVMICLNDQEFVKQNITAFIALFENTYTFIFTSNTLFYAIIELHAAMTICDITNSMYNSLKKNIFQHNFVLAYASVEVLILISHTSLMQHQTNFMLQEFNFWHRCHNSFALFSDNPKRVHVRRLLMNYYNLCQKNVQLKELISTKSHWNPERNFKDLSISLDCEGTEATKIIEMFSIGLSKMLLKLLNGSATVNDYNTIIFYLEMLSNSRIQLESKCYEQLCELIMRIYKLGYLKDIEIIKTHEYFLNAAFTLLKKCPENDNLNKLYDNLWNIIRENKYKSSTEFMTLTSTAYFFNCCLEISTKKFHKFIEFHLNNESAFKNSKGLIFIVTPKHINASEMFIYIKKTYEKMCQLATIKHKCVEKSDIEPPVAKRKCLELDNYDANAKLILNDMHRKIMQISRMELDDEDVQNLTNLNQFISKVLNEKIIK